MAGFDFRFRESGGAPTIISIVAKDTETLTKGDILNLESGQVDLGAAEDTGLLGACQETKAHTSEVTSTEVIIDTDAVYAVTDANAREIGATLDLTGATGAQGVTTSSKKEFVVVRKSSATEETLVRINADAHALGKIN